jgi:hypothetical protein
VRFLSWLRRRPCAHVWVYASPTQGGEQVTWQSCIHCGKVGYAQGGFAGGVGDSGGGGGGGCDGG